MPVLTNSILPPGEHLTQAIAASSIDRTANMRHDAIVVGAGAAGGMAALVLAKAGLNVLCLDASNPPAFSDAPVLRTTGAAARLLESERVKRLLSPTQLTKLEGVLRKAGGLRQPSQALSEAWASLPEAFVDDIDFPTHSTEEDTPFQWIRTHLLGGRMALPGHGRQYYRLSPNDFAAGEWNPDGWPVTYKDLVRWYEFVEKLIDLSGRDDAAGDIPASTLRRATPANASETALITAISKRWPKAKIMLSQHAEPANLMERAAQTGRVLCRTGALVQRVEVDGRKAVRGVHWHDLETKQMEKASAPLVFLCASGLESTRILLNSSEAGVGNKHSQLGRYLSDHLVQRAEGIAPAVTPDTDSDEQGRCIMLPAFNAAHSGRVKRSDRFNVQVRQTPLSADKARFQAVLTAEMPPVRENRVTLHPYKTDAIGAPVLKIRCKQENTPTRSEQRANALRDLAEVAGATLHKLDETPVAAGLGLAEGGTARMGTDPENSVLDPHNQCWEAKGLYVTDSAAMPTQGRVGAALTVMALTARACAHALQHSPQDTKPKQRARLRAEQARQATATAQPEPTKAEAPEAKAPTEAIEIEAPAPAIQAETPAQTIEPTAPTKIVEAKGPCTTAKPKTATKSTKPKATTKTAKAKAPAKRTKAKATTKTRRAKTPATRTKATASAKTTRTKAATKTTRAKAPAKTSRAKTPAKAARAKAPAKTTKATPPAKSAKVKAPARTAKATPPTRAAKAKAPAARATKTRAPAKGADATTPTKRTRVRAKAESE